MTFDSGFKETTGSSGACGFVKALSCLPAFVALLLNQTTTLVEILESEPLPCYLSNKLVLVE